MKNWAGNLEYASRPSAGQARWTSLPSLVRRRRPGQGPGLAALVQPGGRYRRRAHPAGRACPSRSNRTRTARPSGSAAASVTANCAAALNSPALAIHNLASLPHISVAGAIQTGTHGSGVHNQSLAGAVQSHRAGPARPASRTLTRADGDEFLASVVGLGALGIVTGLELSVRPSFRMRQRVLENLPWDPALADFDALVSSAYSVSLFTDYAGDSISQVWLKALDSEPPLDGLFGATAATRPRHPLPDMSAENCTRSWTSPAVAGPPSALPPRVHAQQGRGAAERVHPAAGACPGRHRGRPRTGGQAGSAAVCLGNPDGSRGRILAQPVLPAAERGPALHVEAAAGRRGSGPAGARGPAAALRRQAALGQALHPVAVTTGSSCTRASPTSVHWRRPTIRRASSGTGCWTASWGFRRPAAR